MARERVNIPTGWVAEVWLSMSPHAVRAVLSTSGPAQPLSLLSLTKLAPDSRQEAMPCHTPTHTGQARPGQARPGQDRTGQDRVTHALTHRSGQDRTGQDRTGQDRTGQGHARTYTHTQVKVFIF